MFSGTLDGSRFVRVGPSTINGLSARSPVFLESGAPHCFGGEAILLQSAAWHQIVFCCSCSLSSLSQPSHVSLFVRSVPD